MTITIPPVMITMPMPIRVSPVTAATIITMAVRVMARAGFVSVLIMVAAWTLAWCLCLVTTLTLLVPSGRSSLCCHGRSSASPSASSGAGSGAAAAAASSGTIACARTSTCSATAPKAPRPRGTHETIPATTATPSSCTPWQALDLQLRLFAVQVALEALLAPKVLLLLVVTHLVAVLVPHLGHRLRKVNL